MTPPDPQDVRFLPPQVTPIVKATDLGSVQVLKHGNRYLLTDAFGDIHPDSRGLGLYDGDTRTLACSILRVGGARPVLLLTSVGANYRASLRAKSRADMLNKWKIVEEEADETLFWLELLLEAGVLPPSKLKPLMDEVEEILAMLVASIRTLRGHDRS